MNVRKCRACAFYGWRGGEMHERLATLAHNLAVAGWLCASFALGCSYERVDFDGGSWQPGCGRAAP